MLKGVMNARSMLTTMLAIFFVVAPLANCGKLATAQEQKFKSTVLEQVDLGNLPAGERVLKMTLVEMQPGAAIPAHTHKVRCTPLSRPFFGENKLGWGPRWIFFPLAI